ncbi:MAG: FtsB family cell division protein [Terriglobia bacterium]
MQRQKDVREFDGAETPVNTLRRGLLLALLLIFVAFAVHEIFGDHGWLALRHQRRQVQAIQQRIQQLKQQNHQLQKDVQGLKSDPHTIERYAREQMHFARPGEIIYTFPKHPPGSNPPAAAKNPDPKK